MFPEDFRPPPNTPPKRGVGAIGYYARLLLDFQKLTVLADLRRFLPRMQGNVLDIGCGGSPYRFLLDTARTRYFGIDVPNARLFDYHNPDVTTFDGTTVPFPADFFDGLICTEVLEHVENYQRLVDEMQRVLKPGADAIVTVPWSARFHYIPRDFFRYTPTSLESTFASFHDVQISHRGTDVTVIANKFVVLFFRNLFPRSLWQRFLVPIWVLATPVLVLAVVAGHLSLWLGLGSKDDPLGYTIIVTK